MVIREQIDHRQRGDLTSIGVWRKRDTDLSIQDIHNFNHLRGGIGPHNSQWHKLENNKLEPYIQVFKSLAGFFDEIANEKKFAYVPDQKLRERLKNAKPYLTHDGRVPTMIDLIEIFEGTQPINKDYKTTEMLTQEFLDLFGVLMKEEFDEFARDRLLNTRDAYEELKATKAVSTADEEVQRRIADLLRGEGSPPVEMAHKIINDYKSCPCYDGIKELSDRKTPKLDSMHNKLVDLCLS